MFSLSVINLQGFILLFFLLHTVWMKHEWNVWKWCKCGMWFAPVFILTKKKECIRFVEYFNDRLMTLPDLTSSTHLATLFKTHNTQRAATAHDQNHVTVHFSCVVLQLWWVVELFHVVGTTENILLIFCHLGNSRILSLRKNVFNSPALSEREAKYVSCV